MSVRRAMLALLTEGSQYRLRLRKEFQDRTGEVRTGEVWPLNAGRVRTALQRLEPLGPAGSDGSGTPSAGLIRGRRRVPDA